MQKEEFSLKERNYLRKERELHKLYQGNISEKTSEQEAFKRERDEMEQTLKKTLEAVK